MKVGDLVRIAAHASPYSPVSDDSRHQPGIVIERLKFRYGDVESVKVFWANIGVTEVWIEDALEKIGESHGTRASMRDSKAHL